MHLTYNLILRIKQSPDDKKEKIMTNGLKKTLTKVLAIIATFAAGAIVTVTPASAAVSSDNIEACKMKTIESGDVNPDTHSFKFQSSTARKFSLEAAPSESALDQTSYVVTCTLKRGKVDKVALTKQLGKTTKLVKK
jgi:hypothetical protein